MKNGRWGINRCMIHLQISEFERVSNNVSHERSCQVLLAINKFYSDKTLAILNFLYRKCLLGLYNQLKLNVSQIVCMNRCATRSNQTNQNFSKSCQKLSRVAMVRKLDCKHVTINIV